MKKIKKVLQNEGSFIQHSRSNLKYLKWSYDSIRKNRFSSRDLLGDDFQMTELGNG